MDAVKILEREELAAVASPLRQQLLASLAEPQSAAALARRFDMSRQRIGYHMRDLERAGCIEPAGERRRRGLTEKLYRARSMAYVHAPAARDKLSRQDRFSWAALVNLVARSLWDLVSLRRKADAAGQRLATLALEAELHFDTPAARKAFTEDLIDAVERVVRDHEQPEGAESHTFRLVLGAYPKHRESTDDGRQDPQH